MATLSLPGITHSENQKHNMPRKQVNLFFTGIAIASGATLA